MPDFIRKSILLFFFFFGAVGYFIKNKKPFDSILEERGKQQLTVSASLSSTCNLPTSHLHLCSCPSHISINLCFPHLATKSAVVLNVKTHLCSSCLFSLHVLTKKEKITKKKKNPIPFVHTPVNCFKYLSLFLVGGGEG